MARLLLLLLAVVSAAAQENVEVPGSSDEASGSSDAEKTPIILEDVEEVQTLIDSSELAVIGFFKVKTLARPELALFLVKYVTTLIVGISAIFWVGSKKTCSEWANFFNRTRKRDPVSESRRVLQESCEFFLKHNSTVRHKKKHYKSSTHKLKVISKSMGTSTGAKVNHGTSGVAMNSKNVLTQDASMETKDISESLGCKIKEVGAGSQQAFDHDRVENPLQVATGSEMSTGHIQKGLMTGNGSKVSSICGSMQIPEERDFHRIDADEALPLQTSLSHLPTFSKPSSRKSSVHLPLHPAPGSRKDADTGNNASDA